jgi:hypothetical protein
MTSVIHVASSRTTNLLEDAPPQRPRLQTTLYDLIEALQEVVAPDEDGLVVRTIARLFDAGRITFLTADTGITRAARAEASGGHTPSHSHVSPWQGTEGIIPPSSRCAPPQDNTTMSQLADIIVG